METIILINIAHSGEQVEISHRKPGSIRHRGARGTHTTVEEFEEFRLAGMCDSRAPEVVCYQRAIIFLSNL
jgi:hypothetical protein